MSDFLKEELERSQRDRGRIPVTDDIYIEFDRSDTWFSINDVDDLSYDWMGGVLLSLDMVDLLIDALVQLRSLPHYTSKTEDK